MPEDTPKEVLSAPAKTLIEWDAPARPFKRRTREFYTTIISVSAVIGFILFIVEGIMPVILLISLLFLFYVLSTIEPELIHYVIKEDGIHVGDKVYPWSQMGRFWFTNRFGTEVLIIEADSLAGRLEFVIDSAKREGIRSQLTERLDYEELPPTLMDKAVTWAGKKLPNS